MTKLFPCECGEGFQTAEEFVEHYHAIHRDEAHDKPYTVAVSPGGFTAYQLFEDGTYKVA